MPEVYVVSGVRTAVGDFGGALAGFAPTTLGARVAVEAIGRGGIEASAVGHVVFGQVIQTDTRDMYLSRVVGIEAGVPAEAPALTVNRLCGSGLQAVISAAQAIKLGETGVALAGGAEVMSRAPFNAPGVRWGTRMGDTPLVDTLLGTLTDPFTPIHMGITAENVADRYGITREDQDELAYESHRRASQATREGRFKDQILGIEVKGRKGVSVFAEDEHIRHDAAREDFSKLRPAFKKDGGTVTAGNASGINDGAAALVLASETAVRERNVTPLARLVSYAHAGVDPNVMGIGPIPASKLALERAGLQARDLDVIESNEAFAAQACAVTRTLGLDPAKVNPNGSGISIGHPVGATGAINTVKLIHELARCGGRYGLVTMCIGGGQGIAAIFERV